VLLSELRIESLVLVGHSLGGAIATKVAPELDRSLRALVIVDSGPDSDSQTSEFLQYELRDSHRTYARLEEYTEFLKVRRHLANPTTLERLAVASLILGRDGYKPRYDVAALGVLTSKDDDDWWLPSLQGIPSPVLVVRGMYSACLSKRTAVRMCAAAPNGEFKTVPFAGHAVMTDNMEAFAQVVIPFIARACSQRVTTA
jgi:pimeloyl-ACP methyl ester carboxylesterase